MHLGYLSSGVLFGVVIAIPALAHRRGRLNEIAAFWFAYIVTRPLGASFADWFDATHRRGGLAVSTGAVAAVLTVAVAACVWLLSVTQVDARRGSSGPRPLPVLEMEFD